MPSEVTIFGHQFLAWTLGLAVACIFLDLGAGFVRDHPPLAWRVLGGAVGPAALIAMGLLATGVPPVLLAILGAPFAGAGCAYSYAWVRRRRAVRRRTWGRVTGGAGVFAVLLLMLTETPQGWGGVVIGAYAASAALLGGFTAILVAFLTRGAPDEVPVAPSPFGVLARVVAVGLGISILAAIDIGLGLLRSPGAPVRPVLVWLALSLGAPLVLTGAGHKLYPRLQPAIWAGALTCSLIGQAVLHTLILHDPPFVG